MAGAECIFTCFKCRATHDLTRRSRNATILIGIDGDGWCASHHTCRDEHIQFELSHSGPFISLRAKWRGCDGKVLFGYEKVDRLELHVSVAAQGCGTASSYSVNFVGFLFFFFFFFSVSFFRECTLVAVQEDGSDKTKEAPASPTTTSLKAQSRS